MILHILLSPELNELRCQPPPRKFKMWRIDQAAERLAESGQRSLQVSLQLVFKRGMSQVSTKLYEFGAFRLDASERVLWRGEEMIVLPSKVFDTLWMLVKEEGRVVSKSELMEAIWTDAFVEESNVSQNIYTLRRALGVDEQGRQFIETVPRRGYRFAVPVKVSRVSNDGAAQAAEVDPKQVGKRS